MHYVIWRSDPSELGATKLYKICWYSDLEAYRTLGSTISGATHYKRLQHGPVPKQANRVIEYLQQSGKIAVSTENYFDRPKTMYMARTRPAISAFTSDEVAIIACRRISASAERRFSFQPFFEFSCLVLRAGLPLRPQKKMAPQAGPFS
jgi:hypothetical protein